jgi:hypothetical protein
MFHRLYGRVQCMPESNRSKCDAKPQRTGKNSEPDPADARFRPHAPKGSGARNEKPPRGAVRSREDARSRVRSDLSSVWIAPSSSAFQVAGARRRRSGDWAALIDGNPAGAQSIAVAAPALSARFIRSLVSKAHPEHVLAIGAKQFSEKSAPQPSLVSVPIVGIHADVGMRPRLLHQRQKSTLIHSSANHVRLYDIIIHRR